MEVLARPRLAVLLALGATLVACLTAPAARAATPRVESSVRADGTTVITYTAPAGQHNELLLRLRAEALDPYKRQFGILEDTGVDFYDVGTDEIVATSPLCGPQGTGVGCVARGTRVEVRLRMGDGDDVVAPKYEGPRRGVPVAVEGGGGHDALRMRDSTPTAIRFSGGPGVDLVDYFERAYKPFEFSDDGIANDGLGGDDIDGDVELYIGGEGHDRFAFHGRGRHIVFGTGGDDTVASGPGAEQFDGGYGGDASGTDTPSSDTITYAGRTGPVTVTLDGFADDGAPGEGDHILPTVENVVGTGLGDTLAGPARVPDRRPYRLEAGGGDDVLSGGAGTDLIDAGDGDDVVIALGGRKDAAKCGAGADILIGDRFDVSRDCEQVSHSYLSAAAAQTGARAVATVAVPTPRSRVQATLVRGKRTKAGSRVLRPGAGVHPLRVGLNDDARKALAEDGSLELRLRVRISSPGARTVSASKRIVLSAAG